MKKQSKQIEFPEAARLATQATTVIEDRNVLRGDSAPGSLIQAALGLGFACVVGSRQAQTELL